MFLVEIEIKRDADNQNIKKLKDLLNQAPYFSMQPDIFSRTNLELDNIDFHQKKRELPELFYFY